VLVFLVNGYGDDSAAIQVSNGGVPTVNIVVPVRYTHAHNGVMDRNDFDRTVDLVSALIRLRATFRREYRGVGLPQDAATARARHPNRRASQRTQGG
jgi:hypothetical protein